MVTGLRFAELLSQIASAWHLFPNFCAWMFGTEVRILQLELEGGAVVAA